MPAAFAAIRELLALDEPGDAALVEPILCSHLRFSAAQAKLFTERCATWTSTCLSVVDRALPALQLRQRDAAIISTCVWAAAVERTPLASIARNQAFTVFPGGPTSLVPPPSPRSQALEKSSFLIGMPPSPRRAGDSLSPLRVPLAAPGVVSPEPSGNSSGGSTPISSSAGRSVVVARRATDAADQLLHIRRHLPALLSALFTRSTSGSAVSAGGMMTPADIDTVLSLLLRVVRPASGAESVSAVLRGRIGPQASVAGALSVAAVATAALDAIDLDSEHYPLASTSPGLLHHEAASPATAPSLGSTAGNGQQRLVYVPGLRREGFLRAEPPPAALVRDGAPAASRSQLLPYVLIEDSTDATIVLAMASAYVDVIGCTRSTIMLGPAAVHVTIDGCDGCTIVAASAHITVHNCTDTTLLLWVESHRPLLLGDNRRLRLGPYAARYRGLGTQCAAAGLAAARSAVATGSGRETLAAAQLLALPAGQGNSGGRSAAQRLAAALAVNKWSRPVEVRFTAQAGAAAAGGASPGSSEADVTGVVSPGKSAAGVVRDGDDGDADASCIPELIARAGSHDSWAVLPPAMFTWKAAPAAGGAKSVDDAGSSETLSAAEAVLAATGGGTSAGRGGRGALPLAAKGGAVVAVARGDSTCADVLLPPLASHDSDREHLAPPVAYAAELESRGAAEQRLRKRFDEVLPELGPDQASRLQAAIQAAFVESLNGVGSDGGRAVKHMLETMRSHERTLSQQS